MDLFNATTAELTAELRALATRQEEHANWLEKIHHDNLSRAADLGHTLERLTNLISLVDTRMHNFETLMRDMRLTMTGIGSLAKSLTERIDQHDALLHRLTTAIELLTTLAQKADTP